MAPSVYKEMAKRTAALGTVVVKFMVFALLFAEEAVISKWRFLWVLIYEKKCKRPC